MLYFHKKITIFCLLIFCGFVHIISAEASDNHKYPSLFAVYQQQSSVCPYLPFENLEKIRSIRMREKGHIILQDKDYISKIQSYAWFFPRIRALDHSYDKLRNREGPYAAYEKDLRNTSIKDISRYDIKGQSVETIDLFSIDQARRKNYTPYNFKVESHPYSVIRFLPILHNSDDNQLYFYDYEQRKTTLLGAFEHEREYNSNTDHILYQNINNQLTNQYWCRFHDDILIKMNLDRQELKDFKIIPIQNSLGFPTAYYIQSSSIESCNREYTYLVGTYQHMLFACGLKKDNTPFTLEDIQWSAYHEFHEEMTLNPLNPWRNINKEDIFEYHLAEIFKTYPQLKEMALNSVNFYNNPWLYYKDSFEFYDRLDPLNRIKFSEKQAYLPGEDQMLAYYFSGQLRFVWAASIGLEALIAIEELDNELGENMIKTLKILKFLPFVPSTDKILEESEKRSYTNSNGCEYSFLDTWEAIRKVFMNTIATSPEKVDFVTFSGHGCVISFDSALVELQTHENKDIAKRLGVEMWETLYEKGIKPFYQKPGTEEDLIKFSIK